MKKQKVLFVGVTLVLFLFGCVLAFLFYRTEGDYTQTSANRHYQTLQGNVDYLNEVMDDTDTFCENLAASPQVIAFLEEVDLDGLEENLLDPETYVAKNTNLFVYNSRGYKAYRRLYGMISSSKQYSALALLNPHSNLSIITSENGQYGAVCSAAEDLCRFLGIQELDADWEDKTLILVQPTSYAACEAYVARRIGDQLILLCGLKEGILKNTLTANLGAETNGIRQMVVQSPTGQAVSLYPDADLDSMEIDISALSRDASIQNVNGYTVMLFPGQGHHFRLLTVLQEEGLSRVFASSRFQLFLFANVVWLLIVALIASYVFFRVFRPIRKISAELDSGTGEGDDLKKIHQAMTQYVQQHRQDDTMINEQLTQLRNSYLRHLVWGHYPAVDTEQQERLGIPQLLDQYMLLVIYPDNGYWGMGNTKPDGQMEPAFLAKMENSLQQQMKVDRLAAITLQEYLLVIIPMDNGGREEELREQTRQALEHIQMREKQPLCFGLSKMKRGQRSLSHAYHEAVLNAVRVAPEGERQSEDPSMSALLKQNLQMTDLIHMERFEQAYGVFRDVITMISQQTNRYLREWQMRSFLTRTYFVLTEIEPDIAALLAENHIDIEELGKLKEESSILKKWEKVFSCLSTHKAAQVQEQYSGQFALIYRYMQENFRKGDLSLNMLAEEFQISASTLSREFQKNTGQGFLELLHGMRVEAAKYEIQHTDTPLKEIAVSVGYSNVLTMTRAFKKYVGCTPGEFRKRSRLD